jgi:hypothetical protein
VIEDSNGLSTGLLNNFGDLPFHLSVITSFAFGNNFPPEDPTYAGVRFTYPFISDFVSAMFVRCGADLRESMFIENFILGMSFVGLVHRWALVMLRDRLAAIITPLLVLLNGGLGWKLLFDKAIDNEGGLFGVLTDLPPSFTVIPETTWRWGNAISALLGPSAWLPDGTSVGRHRIHAMVVSHRENKAGGAASNGQESSCRRETTERLARK